MPSFEKKETCCRDEPTICKLDDIDRVVDILARSRSLLFITGAGISADSGLPTYRGIGGLYDAEHPEEGIPIEEILSGEMIRHRPELTWKYLGQMEQAARGAQLNPAHQVIAEMESCFERVWTLTQNIDGLHRQAGAKNVLEIHGSLHDLLCSKCGWRQTVADYSGLSLPPRCPRCQAMLRPEVVLFGETLATRPSSFVRATGDRFRCGLQHRHDERLSLYCRARRSRPPSRLGNRRDQPRRNAGLPTCRGQTLAACCRGDGCHLDAVSDADEWIKAGSSAGHEDMRKVWQEPFPGTAGNMRWLRFQERPQGAAPEQVDCSRER